jgi:hypothetical protein
MSSNKGNGCLVSLSSTPEPLSKYWLRLSVYARRLPDGGCSSVAVGALPHPRLRRSLRFASPRRAGQVVLRDPQMPITLLARSHRDNSPGWKSNLTSKHLGRVPPSRRRRAGRVGLAARDPHPASAQMSVWSRCEFFTCALIWGRCPKGGGGVPPCHSAISIC